MAGAIGWTVAAWAATIVAFAAAGHAIGLELTWGQAALLAAGVSLVTAIPAGPGYVGTFELAREIAGAVRIAAERRSRSRCSSTRRSWRSPQWARGRVPRDPQPAGRVGSGGRDRPAPDALTPANGDRPRASRLANERLRRRLREVAQLEMP
jgi:hypothetical protein